MKITHIHIERFRGFQNEDFEVGSLLTAIAGQNGTQKSTLLGIITQTFTLKTEDTYGIEVEYVRNGANNSRTHVCNYYFFNDNLFATIILSYRQDDIRKWETDFSNIIKTFKWNNKK